MAHENFEDNAMAGLVNNLFVNIKVGREEHPNIDHIYMNALHMLCEQDSTHGAPKFPQPNFSSSCGVLINEHAIRRIKCRLNYPV
jgi:hypothetical protein